jgi:hypothetical protein
MRRAPVLATLFALLALLLLGACGSDDGDDEASDDTAADATESDDTDDTAEDTDDTGDTDDDDGGDDDGGGSDNEFCGQIEELDAMDDLEGETALAALSDLIDDAPEEIRSDLEIVVDRISELEGLEEDDPEAMAQIFALMDDEEFVTASENLEAYGVDECGLPPSEGDFDDFEDGNLVPETAPS